MMGTGTFAEPIFEALLTGPHPVVGLVTNPDRPIGQERGSTRQVGKGMKTIALAHQVPVFQPESINTPEGVEGLRAFRPDLLVVAAYGQILSGEVLAVPPQGGINVHASLLPKYRGAAPIAWAIYHGETRTGVTIIRMSVHLDAGDMLAQEAVDIGPEETTGELEARLAPLGARLALQTIEQIANGTTHGVKQDKGAVTRAPKLTKEHGLIDWTRPARDIGNHIRAMQPWPTAYTFLHQPGQEPLRVILQKAAWHEDAKETGRAPGKPILSFQESLQLHVAAGGHTRVEILELQPAGKRRMTAAEFLRGKLLRAEDFFGPPTS
ncbi:MAG: methionyl-tRNA formyltransferase [Planctomycetes bacterium]|nr:methionyl-tRNA formyltransferase [Planctomycetota bacterium]